MSCGCCGTGAYGEIFGERRSRREARRFRRKGLDRRAMRLVEALSEAVGLDGCSALEIGAGIGGLSLTLLERGVDRAETIDASAAAAMVARELATERGVGDRLAVRTGDFAAVRSDTTHDLVVLDRVVCCYPDWRALLRPAAAATGAALAMTYPRDTWYMRAAARGIDLAMRIAGVDFRFHVHPPAAMHALLRDEGLVPERVGGYGPWEFVIAARPRSRYCGVEKTATL